MKWTKILWVLAVMLIFAAPASAQNWFWGVTWGLSVPGAPQKEYISDVSWRNFGLEGRKFIDANASVGLSFNWSVFNEVTDDTYTQSGTSITGTQYRYINAFPLLATVHRYFGDDEKAQLSVGVGAGASIIERRTEIGLWAINNKDWHFTVAPELGLTFPLGWRAKGLLLFRYNYAAETDGVDYGWWDIRIGLVSL